jgi:hypothetical protein
MSDDSFGQLKGIKVNIQVSVLISYEEKGFEV